ncbi:hypothetical protein Tco_0671772 [Tanacetum coccineum]
MAQIKEIKRLADLKAEKEKSEASLKKIMNPATIKAQAQNMDEYEEKRAKMLEDYNKCITERTDPLLIKKISYGVSSSHEATMRITKGNDPLNVVVHNSFRLNTLGFSKWLEVHALASKTKSKANDQLLKNLRAKFQWIISQAQKLGVPPPQELSTFRISANDKKRKRTSKILEEVFVKENVVINGMHRNLAPLPGVEESEFHLATTPQLIRSQNAITMNTPEAEDMFKILELTIEARNDAAEARRIVKDNLDVMGQHMLSIEDPLNKGLRGTKGLAECQTSASNIRRIQVKDIVKEVEDYLKTYSLAWLDISWYVEGIR